MFRPNREAMRWFPVLTGANLLSGLLVLMKHQVVLGHAGFWPLQHQAVKPSYFLILSIHGWHLWNSDGMFWQWTSFAVVSFQQVQKPVPCRVNSLMYTCLSKYIQIVYSPIRIAYVYIYIHVYMYMCIISSYNHQPTRVSQSLFGPGWSPLSISLEVDESRSEGCQEEPSDLRASWNTEGMNGMYLHISYI